MQPKLNKYEAIEIRGKKRRFQYSFYSHFPAWLEYSVSSGHAECLFCFLFSKNIKKRCGFDILTTQGFDRWKKVHDGKKCAFLTHMGSNPCSQHNNAVRDSQALLNQPNHLANILEVKSKEEKEKDRLRLKTAIACVRWLTFQSCALRGHDEKPGSRNRGNFLEMEKLLAEFCPDIAAVIDPSVTGMDGGMVFLSVLHHFMHIFSLTWFFVGYPFGCKTGCKLVIVVLL